MPLVLIDAGYQNWNHIDTGHLLEHGAHKNKIKKYIQLIFADTVVTAVIGLHRMQVQQCQLFSPQYNSYHDEN